MNDASIYEWKKFEWTQNCKYHIYGKGKVSRSQNYLSQPVSENENRLTERMQISEKIETKQKCKLNETEERVKGETYGSAWLEWRSRLKIGKYRTEYHSNV